MGDVEEGPLMWFPTSEENMRSNDLEMLSRTGVPSTPLLV